MPVPVSVIIPCYQDGQFLEQSIRSVLRQSWPELEIIVSDEGVDPRCQQVVAGFDDNRIKYFLNPERLGMTRNWNMGLARATGDHVMKLDGDDVMSPKTIEVLLNAIKSNPNAGFAACLALECDSNLENCSTYGLRGYQLAGISPEKDQLLTPEFIFSHLFADSQLWHSCAMLFSRLALINIGKWDEKWGCASDTELILRAFLSGYALAHCGYTGIRYRKRQESVSHEFRQDAKLQWETTIIHLTAIKNWESQKKPLSKPLRIAWYRLWLRLQDLRAENSSGEYEYYSTLAQQISPPPPALRMLENVRMKLHNIFR